MRGPEKHSAATVAKISAAVKALWQDPEYRARVVAANTDPVAIEKNIARGKALQSDPEYRAKHLAAVHAYHANQKRRWKTPIFQTRWRKDAAGRAGYLATRRAEAFKAANPEGHAQRLFMQRKNRRSQQKEARELRKIRIAESIDRARVLLNQIHDEWTKIKQPFNPN